MAGFLLEPGHAPRAGPAAVVAFLGGGQCLERGLRAEHGRGAFLLHAVLHCTAAAHRHRGGGPGLWARGGARRDLRPVARPDGGRRRRGGRAPAAKCRQAAGRHDRDRDRVAHAAAGRHLGVRRAAERARPHLARAGAQEELRVVEPAALEAAVLRHGPRHRFSADGVAHHERGGLGAGQVGGPAFKGWESIAHLLDILISFGVVTLMFAMIYKIIPRVRIRWRDVWVGAAVTAALFAVGKFLIGLYLGKSSVASAFGAAGSLVVMMVWVYYSAQIFLLGAEFTWVYAHTFGSRRGQPRPRPEDS